MNGKGELSNLSPREFIQFLEKKQISRFSFIYDEKRDILSSSHSELRGVAEFIQKDKRDFDRHEGLFFQVSKPHNILQGVFVHSTRRGQAAGGVRFWQYEKVGDCFCDGLRLSRAMTQKNALAGLWWGGGKGVMARNPSIDNSDPLIREAVYKDFGRLCTLIRGGYVAAEDVGTTVTDMANIFSKTRFTTCIPQDLGGSGNPSILTAKGVLCGMEAALAWEACETLEGKTVAVQGMGNVGGALIRFLFEKGVKKIAACDIRAEVVEKLKKEFPGNELAARIAEHGDHSIVAEDCDILSLNATGAVLNPRTIPKLKARIICGGANNQLEDADRDDLLLQERGIIYIPDFLTNRMGIVNCANEQYGCMENDWFIERHLGGEWEQSIGNTTARMLAASKKTGEPPSRIAAAMADKLAMEHHPVFGHRGRQIIDELANERWYDKDALQAD